MVDEPTMPIMSALKKARAILLASVVAYIASFFLTPIGLGGPRLFFAWNVLSIVGAVVSAATCVIIQAASHMRPRR